jgi:hypothetical protein
VDYFIDLILNQYPDYHNQFVAAKYESSFSNPYLSIQKQIARNKENKQLDSFISRWIVLEKLLKALTDANEQPGLNPVIRRRESLSGAARKLKEDEDLLYEDIKYLEGIRDKVVFGAEMPDNSLLRNSADSIPVVLSKLRDMVTDSEQLVVDNFLKELL